MKKVTLLFQNENDLRFYARTILCVLEMNIKDLILICECEDAEIELAENAFNAKVIDKTLASQ